MRKLFNWSLLVLLTLSACAPQATEDARQNLPPTTTPLTPVAAVTAGEPTGLPAQATEPGAQQSTLPAEATEAQPGAEAGSTATPAQDSQPSPTPPPASTVTPIAGIHLDNLASPDQVALFQQAGGVWSRFDDFKWDEIEPERMDPAVYHWEAVDETGLLNATSAGANLIGIILFTPSWAQRFPGVFCGPVSEAELDRFAQFVGDLVDRYSRPPYNVLYYEIGNEPEIPSGGIDPHSGFGCWGNGNDPLYGGGYYGEVLKVVYPRLKAANPEAQLLVGGLLLDCDPNNPPANKDCSPAKFLEGILSVDAGSSFDGVSFHAYDYYALQLGQYSNVNWNSSWDTTGPVLIAKARYVKDLLAAHNQEEKLLFNTEVALICGREGTEPECQTEDFANTKAYFMAQAYAAALAEGLDGNIWYSFNGWRGSGLVDGSLQPNPAFLAFQNSSAQLKGAAFSRSLDQFPGMKGYEFDRGGDQLWVLWSVDGQQHDVPLPGSGATVTDVFGNSLQADGEINVGIEPVYVAWIP